MPTSYVRCLKCRECGAEYPAINYYYCEKCLSPLDVVYDYREVELYRKDLKGRPLNLWRYYELLPLKKPSNIVSLGAGWTPLRLAARLTKKLGVKRLYVKDDTVNPTQSFKDRPASVAVSKAVEFKAKAVGCASTGNLAAATAAHAAKAGLPCYVLMPSNTEVSKVVQAATYGAKLISIAGNYDQASWLATQLAEELNWAFVNINVRPYYVEGSKTPAFEICEQMDWEQLGFVVIPMASGALINAMCKGS